MSKPEVEMRVMRSIPLFLLMFLLMLEGQAATLNGGKGLPHTKAAFTTPAGHLTAMGNLRMWGKKSTFTYESLGIESGSTIWVVQGAANFTYGIHNHIAASLTPIFYQDTHKENGDDLPWDAFLNIKFGHFKVERAPVWVGFDIGARLPTGEDFNVMFEDYTAGAFEFGATGLFSYRYATPDLKNDIRIHANLGYWNYNDSGRNLIPEKQVAGSIVENTSQSFKYALGVEFPTKVFEYGLEIYGLAWIFRPPVVAASRENYLYMNVNFGYKPHPRYSFFINSDLRLMSGKNTTVGLEPNFPGFPSYSGWRINVGMRYLILPKSIYVMHEKAIMRKRNQKTKVLYTQLQKEIEKTQRSIRQLEKLKKEKQKKEAQIQKKEDAETDIVKNEDGKK
jgi:hypothetical protein